MPEHARRSLADLVAAAEIPARVQGDAVVEGLSYDSRTTRPGDVFFCIPGARSDGHVHAPNAVAAGAAALCAERTLGLGVPEVIVEDARRAMARVAREFWGRPDAEMTLLGVTGTNGKTTTTFLLESILRAAGATPGLIGTVMTRIAGEERPGVRTTPESVDLYALLSEMRNAGVDAVAMEVTSHGLVLGRVDGIRYAAAGFTNLSQDHLDFHSGMEDYFAAKRSLFVPDRAAAGAVNADDPYGRRLLDEARIPCVSFGTAADADVRAVDVDLAPHGSEFVIQTAAGDMKVSSSLVGAFNVSNCLAAAAVALQAGVDPAAVEQGLNDLPSVPGRFEAVVAGQPFTVVVDYAHTPDSLDNVLRAARSLVAPRSGRVICVFGCGGDRDRGKRPLMGAVVARLADLAVVTSDNPRSEDPHAILDQVLEGVLAETADGPAVVDVDRRSAIKAALDLARPNDIVVIAGKGHEPGQEFAGFTVPFDDRQVAREILGAMGFGA